MKIHCLDKTVDGVLAEGYSRIPRFQRPYSWDRDNIEEFWNDTIEESESDYFIGSMVVYEAGDDTLGVVDGQQRLTTITMILCALRNALRARGVEDLAKGLQTKVERPDIRNKLRFVLQSETSSPFFQEAIQTWDGPPGGKVAAGHEEANLEDAFALIEAKVKAAVQDVEDDESLAKSTKRAKVRKRLEQIRDRVLGLKVIFIRIDDEDDAYVIFETMNTRGKDLRVSDLVKNYLMRLIGSRHSELDPAKDKWGQLVDTVEQAEAELSVDSFLHHLWLSRYQYTTVQMLFKRLKKQVKKAEAKPFLESLLSDARTYREIQDTKFRNWTKAEQGIRQSLDALTLFRVKQDLPMLLSVMRAYRDGDLKPKHLARILTAIEHFHFLFTAVASQRSSGGISLMYALHARDLFAARNPAERIEVIEQLVDKLRARRPVYAEFEARFVEIAYTSRNTKQRRLVQYILAKMDRHFASGPPISYDEMTIEHLAPENPKQGPALAQTEVGRIGNLILAGPKLNHEQLRNRPFAEKKPLLVGSGVWTDEVLKGATAWGKDEIRRRSKALAKVAYDKVWRL